MRQGIVADSASRVRYDIIIQGFQAPVQWEAHNHNTLDWRWFLPKYYVDGIIELLYTVCRLLAQ